MTNICIFAEYTANIAYNSHVQDYGWEEDFSKKDGEISGTTGASKRIEALKIELGSLKKTYPNTSIKYQVHVQDYDWMNWKKDGEVAGTIGESKRIEAIKIKLQGLDEYSVIYRVHVQDYGWTDWNSNGEIAGTIGKSKRIEAIQIKIIKGNYEKFKVSIKNENNNNINEYYKISIHMPHYQQILPEGWCITNIGELLINRDGERKPVSMAIRSKQINKVYDYYGAAGVID